MEGLTDETDNEWNEKVCLLSDETIGMKDSKEPECHGHDNSSRN